jgi:hypothetical protein
MKTVLLGSKLHCDHVKAPVILVDSGEYRAAGMYAGVKTSYVYPITGRSESTNWKPIPIEFQLTQVRIKERPY